jgi:hypothetical protein
MTTRMAVSLLVVLGLGTTTPAQSPDTLPAEKSEAVSPVASMPAEAEKASVSSVESKPATAEKTAEVFADPSVQEGDPADRWWVTGDVLLGWIRGGGLPPLVTTSPPGTRQTSAGVLGQPGTRTLFGHTDVNEDLRAGLRLGVGGWLDAERTLGVDAGCFVLESQNTPFFASSQGNPILARPFLDVTTNAQTSQLVAFPGVVTGSVAVSDRSNNLYGAHVDVEEVIVAKTGFRLESLLGYRFLRFDDALSVQQSIQSLGAGVVAAGTQIQTQDRFGAENEFHGLDLGLRAEVCYERWSLQLLSKLAVGGVSREVTIAGNTRVTVPGAAPVASSGGMLALSSNSGVHNSEDWVVVPEFGATLGWDINCNWRLRLGYSVLIWTDVARSGDQVDLGLNPNLFPPVLATSPSRPAFALVKTDMWVQSLSLGVEFHY